MLLSRLFQKRRPVPHATHAASRSHLRRTRSQLFGSEPLEQRLALAGVSFAAILNALDNRPGSVEPFKAR